MNNQKGSSKRDQISKNNSRMVVAFGIAGAVVGFSLVTSFSLIKQMTYKSKVIDERVKADQQLKDNVEAVKSLVQSYEAFDGAPESIIGTPDNNSKIILDALPSQYDFPALATTLQKIMEMSGMGQIKVGGTDNEANAEQSSINPQPIEIPFTVSGNSAYTNIQTLIGNFERSIRPIKILKIELSGAQNALNVNISGITYYQPKKNLEIPLKEVQ